MGSAIAQAVTGFPPGPPSFDSRSDQVGFVDKVTLRLVFSKRFDFPF
jgi:hypothetical protein